MPFCSTARVHDDAPVKFLQPVPDPAARWPRAMATDARAIIAAPTNALPVGHPSETPHRVKMGSRRPCRRGRNNSLHWRFFCRFPLLGGCSGRAGSPCCPGHLDLCRSVGQLDHVTVPVVALIAVGLSEARVVTGLSESFAALSSTDNRNSHSRRRWSLLPRRA
jgi:hypothetical protein